MTIQRMKLDLEIPAHVVESDLLNINIPNLEKDLFMRIASGKIMISVDA